MNKEFPELDETYYQEEFLKDWWSRRKLFRGYRQTGKTTLMLCEAKRFSDNQFHILYLLPSQTHISPMKRRYGKLFGEMPTFDIKTYGQVKEGSVRGMRKEVIICDEFQEIDFQSFGDEILPMNPMFIRASACESSMNSVHYLSDQEDGDFFDSVYER